MRVIKSAEAPPPLQLTPQTRFQQNYRIASAVNAGTDVVAVANGQGNVELFTVGSDSTVWNFYPDPSSDTGYSGVSTGLQAGSISAGLDAQGHIVLFTSVNLQLWYVVETGNSTTRWTQQAQVAVPQPPGATKIAAVRTSTVAGQLYVAALTEVQNAFGPVYNVAWSQWDGSNPLFQSTTTNFVSTHCVWLGQTAQSAAFACVDHAIAAYSVATGTVAAYPMAAPFQSLSVDAAPDNTGNDRIVAVLADGNAYILTGGANDQPYSWAQLSSGQSFRQIAVDADSQGNVSIFAVSGDNSLYHWDPLSTSPTGYSDPPLPIGTGTATIAVAANDSGDIDIFAVGTAHNTLAHLFQDETSSLWVRQALEVPASGEVEEYISYTTDLNFADAAGAPLPNLPVTVRATEAARVTINGATYFISPHKAASVSTNGSAVLSIAQETGSLDVPDLAITVPSFMAPGESVALAQSTVTQTRLASVAGSDLMSAQDASGNYLLSDQYRTPATTDDLATAFQNCMSLPSAPAAHPALLGRHAQKQPGLWYARDGSAAAGMGRRIAPAGEPHWQLSFAGGAVSYRALTQGEAAALLAFKRASLPDAFGLFDWIESVGDFLAGVVDGVIDVLDTVVTKVGNAVNAAITFVVDGVQAVFNAVIDTVEQAFALVEMIFARVKVVFEKVFEWLGFLFDWPDMLRTHTALAYGINQYLGFLQGASAGMQRILDSGIDNVQGQLATLFDNAVRDIAGTSTLGGYDDAHAETSPEFSSSVANTVIANAIMDNAGSATITAALLARIDTDPITQYIQQLEQFAGTTAAGQAFASASAYFQNLGGSVDQIFSSLLAGMMQVVQGVLQSVLSAVKALIDGLFQLLQSLLASFRALLNEEWNIPFLSQFYSFITGGAALTTIDLIALLVAVPTTIVYKSVHGAAPFPDGASVAAFESSFNAQTLLGRSGLGASSVRDEQASLGPQGWLVAAAAVSTFYYGLTSAALDGLPKESLPEAAATFLSAVAFVLEGCAQACSCPWLASTVTPDCTTAGGTAAILWLYESFGCLLDAAYIAAKKRIPENSNDAAVTVAFVYACGQLIVSIVASVPAQPVARAGYIISCIPPLSKLALLTNIVKATGKQSPIVVAAVDGVFYTTAAILNFAASSSSATTAHPVLATA